MTMPPGAPGGAQPDSGILAQILLKQGEMSTQLAVMLTKMETLPDHEQRIRGLERWRYALPLTALASVGSIGLAAAALLLGHR